MHVPRVLFSVAAALSMAGAALHSAAGGKALPIIAASGLPHFYSGSFKALWLADSATMAVLATICIVLTARLQIASRWLLILLACIPLATATLLYTFVGNFFAGHLLLGIAGLVILAAVRLPRSASVGTQR